MAGTGYHPEGHVTKPYENRIATREFTYTCRYGPDHEHVICTNCFEVCPVDPECIDDY